ncbi:DUF4401 domain-containing protein [Pigmentiphaga aceris]|nr:DUF4401 domain-containing protein [Pigmentiphaga aceris]
MHEKSPETAIEATLEATREAAHARDLALWQRLHAAGLVKSPSMPDPRSETPWFLRAITGAAAWLAALLLTIALGFMMFDSFSKMPETGFAAVGAMIALSAGVCMRANLGTFLLQGLTALSLAGQLIVACGLVLFHETSTERALAGGTAVFVLALVLYLLNRVSLHRFICGVAMAFSLYFMLGGNPVNSLFDGNGMMVVSVLLPLVLNCVAIGLWLASRPVGAHPGLAPLTWAFTLCATAIPMMGVYYDFELMTLTRGVLLFSSAMPALFAALLMWPKRALVSRKMMVAVPVVLLVLSPFWQGMPGIAMAVMWMLGGFALARPLLMAFGLACLPVYLVRNIYLTDLTLLDKAVWLGGAGVFMLLLWAIWQAAISHRTRQAVGVAHANPESAS